VRILEAVLECVANVSEGRDHTVLEALADACGRSLLDLHSDVDHHRSVFTLAGPGLADAAGAARALARRAVDLIDLRAHDGAHPRFGVVDVVPFVALDEPAAVAVDAACAFARWIADELGVPAFLYGDADPGHRTLPETRRDAFVRRAPDCDPTSADQRAGAVAVGARPPLVAVNCRLDRDDVALARDIARRVRERDGGLPGVRALGFRLDSVAAAQVSMNVTDLDATGVEVACREVRLLAGAAGAAVAEVELVGLVPAAEQRRWSREFRSWSGLGPEVTIEARLAAARPPRR
jgi:glutamate formiminotransferase